VLCSPRGLLCENKKRCKGISISGSENGHQYRSCLHLAVSFGNRIVRFSYQVFTGSFYLPFAAQKIQITLACKERLDKLAGHVYDIERRDVILLEVSTLYVQDERVFNSEVAEHSHTPNTRWFPFCVLRHQLTWGFPILLGENSVVKTTLNLLGGQYLPPVVNREKKKFNSKE
jgi:hypothetical protein